MRRCWGFTRKHAFCKRHGDWWLFCPEHKHKLGVYLVVLVFPWVISVIHFSGSVASLLTLLIGPTKQDMREIMQQVPTSIPQETSIPETLPSPTNLRVIATQH